MAAPRWQGEALKSYGSDSEYGKGLSDDQKLETFKKLTGKDLNLFDYRSGVSFNGAGNTTAKEYQNLFEKDRRTGQMKLKADVRRGGFFGANAETNAKKEERLKAALLKDAYDEAIRGTFEQSDASPEEAAQMGPAGFGNKWVKRTNKITGQVETIQDKDEPDESNFWRKYKKPIIQTGGGVLGFLVGGPMGAVSGANLAGTIRDAYEARVEARKYKDYLRDWENDPRNQPWQPTPGQVYQSAGEGVVEYNTKDIEKKKKGAYLKEGSK